MVLALAPLGVLLELFTVNIFCPQGVPARLIEWAV